MTNPSGAAATTILAPQIRDLAELSGQLTNWLSQKMPGARDLQICDLAYPTGAGRSHETILFDVAWREGGAQHTLGLVVRIKPTNLLVYQDDMFEAQYEVMRVADASGYVRIAKPLWLERDATLLGAPFFVMEKRAGQVPITWPSYAKAGWLFEASETQRRTLWEDSVRQLASIQKIPLDQVSFLSTGARGDGFDQELDRWSRYLNWASAHEPLEFHQNILDRLLATAPRNRPEGIVWGDARLGNMMFGDDFRVVAVMDWEQPSLGGALHDLGWWLFSEYLRTTAQDITTLPGMGQQDETVALWEEVSGRSAADLEWYIDFAAFKMGCIGAKMARDRDPSLGGLKLIDTATNRFLSQRLNCALVA